MKLLFKGMGFTKSGYKKNCPGAEPQQQNSKNSSYENRTRVSAVRGRRLNPLTNEPYNRYYSFKNCSDANSKQENS